MPRPILALACFLPYLPRGRPCIKGKGTQRRIRSLFLLKLVKVICSSAASHVNIISYNTRFFEELNVLHLLIRNSDILLQSKVKNCDKLILSAWLEEGVFDV